MALGLVAAVAALALILDTAGYHAASALRPRLAGNETVVVWGHGLESADAAAARAGEILAAMPGVTAVTPLDPGPGDPLVARILGAPGKAAADERLLAVKANGAGEAMAARIARTLKAHDVPARAADHVWRDSAGERAAGIIAIAAGLAAPLAIAIFALICFGEARREMARSHDTIELLRASGAADGHIVGLVRARVAGLAFTAAVWGAAAALIAAALAQRTGVAKILGGLTREDLISPWPLAILAAWLAGVAGAWLGARARMKRTP
ncbi:MAG: hypothetical protein ACREEB_18695 [Caulobacteraceae bacterium]